MATDFETWLERRNAAPPEPSEARKALDACLQDIANTQKQVAYAMRAASDRSARLGMNAILAAGDELEQRVLAGMIQVGLGIYQATAPGSMPTIYQDAQPFEPAPDPAPQPEE